MKDILEKTREYMAQCAMAAPGTTVAAAFSGGTDSLAMTLLLKELAREEDFSLVLFHVNHHIRGAAADADSAFARDFAEKEGLQAFVFDVDPVSYASSHPGVSLEEAARLLRYRAMADSLSALPGERKVLAVAHHLEDCAETILFRLARGTGPFGMGALAPVTKMPSFGNLTLIRPVLPRTRAELEEVVSSSPYTAREDETNADDALSRNRIRHAVLPALAAINSGAVAHIVSFAEKTAAQNALLEAETRSVPGLFLPAEENAGQSSEKDSLSDRGQECGGAPSSFQGKRLSRKVLYSLPRAKAECAVFLWLRDNVPSMRDVGGAQIEAVLSMAAAQKGPGKETYLPGEITVRTDYDSLFLVRPGEEGESHAVEVLISREKLEQEGGTSVSAGGKNIILTLHRGAAAQRIVSEEIPRKRYTKYFDYGRIDSDFLCLRTRREGDIIAFAPGKVKKLRRYFIDEKLPAEERAACLLLADGSRILWVIGGRIGADYRLGPDTACVLEATCGDIPE